MSTAPPLSYADIRERLRNASAVSSDDELLVGESRSSGVADPFTTGAGTLSAGGILAEPLTRRVSGFGALAGAILFGAQAPAALGAAGAVGWTLIFGLAGVLFGSLLAIATLAALAYATRNIGAAWTILLATVGFVILASILLGGDPFAGIWEANP